MAADTEMSALERRIAVRLGALPEPEPTMSRGRALLAIRRRVDELRAARRRRSAVLTGLGVLLVGGVAAAAPPVRSWIGAHMKARPVADSGYVVRAPAPHRIANAVRAGNTVFFNPTADEVVVRFDVSQRGGTLTIGEPRVAENSIAALGATSDEIVVLPGGLRIRNDSTASTSYELMVSNRIRTVWVLVGGRDRVVSIDPNVTLRIPLSR